MIRKMTYRLGRHVSAVASRTIQVRRFLHGAYFRIQPTIQEALVEGRPVVALESTIITHGMAYPQNLSTAREVEEIVRTNGAVPATVGVVRGRIHIGLTDEELQFLAGSKNVVKVSRRDLPYVLSQGLSGGTTVSGTMIAAHKAGIPLFVTGGIGGVHRGGQDTLDVSADLTELGRTPVAVVSAGVKSILDIGRTLEYLETQGVCVAAFGESREFPAFFSRQSGFQAPYHVRNEEEAAELIASALGLGLSSGVLIAVPCPPEQAASGHVVEEAIQQALREAKLKGIAGKEVTPFLLQKISDLTDGESLASNIALIQNNARVGSCIAVALSELQKATRKRRLPQREDMIPPQPVVIGGINVDFIAKAQNSVILGEQLPLGLPTVSARPLDHPSVVRDEGPQRTQGEQLTRVKEKNLVELCNSRGQSRLVLELLVHPGTGRLNSESLNLRLLGLGEGRGLKEQINGPLKGGISAVDKQMLEECGDLSAAWEETWQVCECLGSPADCLSRLGVTPLFLSAMGKDEHSESILHYCHHMDMRAVLQLEGKNTATYCAVITSAGELSVGLGDMDIHEEITEQYVSRFKESLLQAPLVCIDGNVPLATLQYVCELAREHRLAVCYEPTDENKASKPFLSDSWKALTFISPNLQELRAINRTLGNPLPAEVPSTLEDVVKTAMTLARPLLTQLCCVVVTLGAHGVLLCGRSVQGSVLLCPRAHDQSAAASLCAAHYPTIHIKREEIVNVSGAGDSLMAGIIAGMLANHDTDTCVRMGLLAANLSLRSYEPISPEISTRSVSLDQVKSRSWPEVKIWEMD